jgi:hypothetical protein
MGETRPGLEVSFSTLVRYDDNVVLFCLKALGEGQLVKVVCGKPLFKWDLWSITGVASGVLKDAW